MENTNDFLKDAYVEFDYKKHAKEGEGYLYIDSEKESHSFFFCFTIRQEKDYEDGCHSSAQETPDEIVYLYDLLDQILDFDELIQKIEIVFNVENIKERLFNFIDNAFYSQKERTYLYTIKND